MMHDVGLITLKGNPGQRVGWLGVAWNDSLPPFVGNIVILQTSSRPNSCGARLATSILLMDIPIYSRPNATPMAAPAVRASMMTS
jgi:hypothetical protein